MAAKDFAILLGTDSTDWGAGCDLEAGGEVYLHNDARDASLSYTPHDLVERSSHIISRVVNGTASRPHATDQLCVRVNAL